MTERHSIKPGLRAGIRHVKTHKLVELVFPMLVKSDDGGETWRCAACDWFRWDATDD